MSPSWAMSPIPRISDGQSGNPKLNCSRGAIGKDCRQFDGPCEEGPGDGRGWQVIPGGQRHGDVEGVCSGDWTSGVLVDRVKLPADLPAGEYVLSWRWVRRAPHPPFPWASPQPARAPLRIARRRRRFGRRA